MLTLVGTVRARASPALGSRIDWDFCSQENGPGYFSNTVLEPPWKSLLSNSTNVQTGVDIFNFDISISASNVLLHQNPAITTLSDNLGNSASIDLAKEPVQEEDEEAYLQPLRTLQASHGMKHHQTLKCLYTLDWNLMRQGRFALAEKFLGSTMTASSINIDDAEPLTLYIYGALARALYFQHKYSRCLDILKRVYERTVQHTYPHEYQFEAMLNYGRFVLNLISLGVGHDQMMLCERLLEECVSLGCRFLPPNNRNLISAQVYLADILRRQGRCEAANNLLSEAASFGIGITDSDDSDNLRIMFHLGLNLQLEHTSKEAEQVLQSVFARQLFILGPEHQDTVESWIELGSVRMAIDGDYTGLQEACSQATKLFPKSHRLSIIARYRLASILSRQGKMDEASAILEDVLLDCEAKEMVGKVGCKFGAQWHFADVCWRQGRHEKAVFMYTQALKFGLQTLGRDHPAIKRKVEYVMQITGEGGFVVEGMQRLRLLAETRQAPSLLSESNLDVSMS